jgi:hypothetical protein
VCTVQFAYPFLGYVPWEAIVICKNRDSSNVTIYGTYMNIPVLYRTLHTHWAIICTLRCVYIVLCLNEEYIA